MISSEGNIGVYVDSYCTSFTLKDSAYIASDNHRFIKCNSTGSTFKPITVDGVLSRHSESDKVNVMLHSDFAPDTSKQLLTGSAVGSQYSKFSVTRVVSGTTYTYNIGDTGYFTN